MASEEYSIEDFEADFLPNYSNAELEDGDWLPSLIND